MKKAIITLLSMVAALTASAATQDGSRLLGSWSGKLNVGSMQLTLVLHLDMHDGAVAASLDSPDQGVKGLAAVTNHLSDDSVAVSVAMINAAYRARRHGDRLEGTFTQNGMSFPLVLQRGESVPRRPQRPQEPYPYATEEVGFSNVIDGATLAGTLTYPAGYDRRKGDKPAVVLLVSGSGLQNRNEELFGHEPFLVIADYLARHGIATLRYDDRATGASVGGDVATATTADFLRDAVAGMQWLRDNGQWGRVGCLGHSEGGSIAIMLAAQGKADFIVTLAAPGVKGDTLMAEQANRLLALSGMPATMTAEKYRQQPAVQANKWLQWFINYDPSADLKAAACPVFALNGERDCQVIAEQNLTAIKTLLPENNSNKVKEYPQLNHLFQHCTTGLPSEYGQIEETISPEVLADVAEWINCVTVQNQ